MKTYLKEQDPYINLVKDYLDTFKCMAVIYTDGSQQDGKTGAGIYL